MQFNFRPTRHRARERLGGRGGGEGEGEGRQCFGHRASRHWVGSLESLSNGSGVPFCKDVFFVVAILGFPVNLNDRYS